MAIQLIRQPGEVSFSRNPMVFEMRTDRIVMSPGRKYVGSLTLSSTAALMSDGTLVTFNVMGRELRFVWRTVVDNDDGYMYPCPMAGETPAAYMSRLVVLLRNNYYLGKNFVMAVIGNSISFTAVENGDDYAISITKNSPVAGLSLSTSQTGMDKVIAPNIKILAELYVGDKLVVSAPLLPDDTGLVRWDVGASLSAFLLRDGHDRPNLSMPVMEKSKTATSYYIRYTELYGESQIAHKVYTTAVKWAWYGGFSKSVLMERTIGGWLLSGGKSKFLNVFFEGKKVVKLDQPSFLYWPCLAGAVAMLDVVVTLYFSDNTTDTYTARSLANVALYDKVIVPSGVNQLNAHLRAGTKAIVEYDVVLRSGGVDVSDKVRYQIDYRNNPYLRFFLYENGLGGYETIYMHGKRSLGYEIDGETARLVSIRDFVLADGEYVDYDLTLRESEKIFTGYKPKREIRALRDFFLSTEKYVYKNGRYYPVTLSTSTLDEFEDGNNLYGLSFEIGSRHVEELFAGDDEEIEYTYAPNLQGYVPSPVDVENPNFDDRYYLKTETYNRPEIDNMLQVLRDAFTFFSNNVNSTVENQNALIAGKADRVHEHPEYVSRDYVDDRLFDLLRFGGVWAQPDSGDPDDEGYLIGNVVIHKNGLWLAIADDVFTEPGVGEEWQLVMRGSAEMVNDETVSYADTSVSLNTPERYGSMAVGGVVWSKVNEVVWTKMSVTDWKVDVITIK